MLNTQHLIIERERRLESEGERGKREGGRERRREREGGGREKY